MWTKGQWPRTVYHLQLGCVLDITSKRWRPVLTRPPEQLGHCGSPLLAAVSLIIPLERTCRGRAGESGSGWHRVPKQWGCQGRLAAKR